MKIAPACALDEDAVVTLWRESGLVIRQNDPAVDFRLAAGGVNSAVLVGSDPEGGIWGSVMVGHDGHRGWLYYVAVRPSRRGQGRGRALVEAAETWLAARGLPKAQLMIRDTNLAVQGFYERLGYRAVPRAVMQKTLPSKGWPSKDWPSKG